MAEGTRCGKEGRIEGESMTSCNWLDQQAEKNKHDYQSVRGFARAAFTGVLPDAKTYVQVGNQAENKFKEADVDVIRLAVSEARREIRDSQ